MIHLADSKEYSLYYMAILGFLAFVSAIGILVTCYKVGFKRIFVFIRNVLSLHWLWKLLIRMRQRHDPTKYILEGVEHIVNNDVEIVSAIVEGELTHVDQHLSF